jgi:hypothetical protein
VIRILVGFFVRGEYTKTNVDKIIFLTEEVTQQLNLGQIINIALEGYATKTKKREKP